MSKRKETHHQQQHREEEQAQEQQQKLYPVHQSATFAGGTLLATLPFDLLCHFGPTGLFMSGLASLVAWRHGPEIYEYVRGMLSSHGLLSSEDDEASALKEEPQTLNASRSRHRTCFQATQQAHTMPLVPRITMEQDLRHTPRNSYQVYLGRSLTVATNTRCSRTYSAL